MGILVEQYLSHEEVYDEVRPRDTRTAMNSLIHDKYCEVCMFAYSEDSNCDCCSAEVAPPEAEIIEKMKVRLLELYNIQRQGFIEREVVINHLYAKAVDLKLRLEEIKETFNDVMRRE